MNQTYVMTLMNGFINTVQSKRLQKKVKDQANRIMLKKISKVETMGQNIFWLNRKIKELIFPSYNYNITFFCIKNY